MSGTYENLKVWQRAMELVADIYQSTRRFPKEEIYCRNFCSRQYRRRQGQS